MTRFPAGAEAGGADVLALTPPVGARHPGTASVRCQGTARSPGAGAATPTVNRRASGTTPWEGTR
ncbi:hypothetical protein Shyhy02_36430 [Streptomyces hygroscopicus subsp. hygroscopicus]|nr:hypothetical protein Shyhy02_36430 [Streptomyces hygroscopicus subsp. hygroscopicus]